MFRKKFCTFFPSASHGETKLSLPTFTTELTHSSRGKRDYMEVTNDTQLSAQTLCVVGRRGPIVLRRDWLHDIHLDWVSSNTLTTHNTLLTVRQLTQEYPDVVQLKLGTIKKFKAISN